MRRMPRDMRTVPAARRPLGLEPRLSGGGPAHGSARIYRLTLCDRGSAAVSKNAECKPCARPAAGGGAVREASGRMGRRRLRFLPRAAGPSALSPALPLNLAAS